MIGEKGLKMKFNIIEQFDNNLKDNEFSIVIKANKNNNKAKDIIKYIKNYDNDKVLVHKGYETFMIDYKDIILFYSENKSNYCKTYKGIYKIKSKLYELENTNKDFIRISKRCIININYVKCFDRSQTGKIIVILFDGTEENVSRRKIRDVLDFLEDKSI